MTCRRDSRGALGGTSCLLSAFAPPFHCSPRRHDTRVQHEIARNFKTATAEPKQVRGRTSRGSPESQRGRVSVAELACRSCRPRSLRVWHVKLEAGLCKVRRLVRRDASRASSHVTSRVTGQLLDVASELPSESRMSAEKGGRGVTRASGWSSLRALCWSPRDWDPILSSPHAPRVEPFP